MLNECDHLNELDPVVIQCGVIDITIRDMRALVAAVRKSNHGTQRLLSELVRQIDADANPRPSHKRVANAINEAFLEWP